MKKYQDYKHKVVFPVTASFKLDGIFCKVQGGKFMSKNGNEFTSMTHLDARVYEEGTEGELYHNIWNFETICSAVKRKEADARSKRIHFITHSKIHTFEVSSEEELNYKLGYAVGKGYEGLVLHTNKGVLKYKPVHDEEYTIIGYTEGKGKLANKVGRLIFAGFTASVKGTHEYLAELWSDRANLIGKVATVEYQNKTNKGIPRFPKVKAIRDYE